MSRIRSLVTTVEINVAQRAHNCQGNANHRLARGDRRLAVKNERGWDHYCLACGTRILERDAVKIASVLRAINGGGLIAKDNDHHQ